MSFDFDDIPAPQRLALTYAAPELRTYLGFLLSLDRRLASILQKTSEPLMAQMRIAWWNEVFGKSVQERPKGEPLIDILNNLEINGTGRDIVGTARKLTGAWELVLADEVWSDNLLQKYAVERAASIFGGYANAVRATDAQLALVHKLGTRWAMNDLQQYCTNETQSVVANMVILLEEPEIYVPRNLRPLSILARGARLERGRGRFAGAQLIWHALTGR